jgi:TPR repeat protein
MEEEPMRWRALKEGIPLVCLALSLIIPPGALATFEDGMLAYEKGDYRQAFREFFEAAQQGQVAAQHNLGVLYETGRGVAQDYAEAARWYRKAADQGNSASQYNLGVMYANGTGVAKDEVEAVRWFRKAADQGSAEATQPRHTV